MENVSKEQTGAKLCSTCRNSASRPGQRTCKECHKEYMREWNPQNRKTVEAMAFVRGAKAMRERLEIHFTNILRGEMNGLTAAEIVRQCPIPVQE